MWNTNNDRPVIENVVMSLLYEPRHEKTCLRSLQPVKTQLMRLASLEISAIASGGIILSRQQTTKALIRLHGCTG